MNPLKVDQAEGCGLKIKVDQVEECELKIKSKPCQIVLVCSGVYLSNLVMSQAISRANVYILGHYKRHHICTTALQSPEKDVKMIFLLGVLLHFLQS
jgi:hypothetical protein